MEEVHKVKLIQTQIAQQTVPLHPLFYSGSHSEQSRSVHISTVLC